jgi:HSP20 family protein
MDQETKKDEVVPVKKESTVGRFSPKSFLTPFEEMERMFDDFFPGSWLRSQWKGWPSKTMLSSQFEERIPKVDVIDRDDEVFIKAELPGIEKEDIDVSMTDHTITIKGSSKKEEKEEKGDYYRCEITQGAFSRSLSLPAEVNIDKSKAKFKDGVLELTLPKMESAKRRNIEVN